MNLPEDVVSSLDTEEDLDRILLELRGEERNYGDTDSDTNARTTENGDY